MIFVLTIIGVKSNQVQIEIDAPKEVEVYREKIYEHIKRGKKQKDDEGCNR